MGSLFDFSLRQIRDRFKDHIVQERNKAPLSTGFSSLDRLLNGNITAQLYAIGAVSGAGKTTLCLNIAESIAEQGHPVLFYSLEMGSYALFSKLVARRLSACCSLSSDANPELNASDILNGANYNTLSDQKLMVIQQAEETLDSDVLDNLHILTPDFIEGLTSIEAHITEAAGTGRTPVVFIDYLQLFADMFFSSNASTEKERIDQAVAYVHSLCTKHRVPVFLISSINRISYAGDSAASIQPSSFKGSGSIEYSADVLLGLEQEGKESGSEKKIKITKMKDRMGELGSCIMNFNGAHCSFSEPQRRASDKPRSLEKPSVPKDEPDQVNIEDTIKDAILSDLRSLLKSNQVVLMADISSRHHIHPFEVFEMIRETEMECADGYIRLKSTKQVMNSTIV